MKKLVVTLFVLIMLINPLMAKGREGLGLGVILGSPTGISGKYWLDKIHAIDAALGFSGDFALHADYLWHGWKAFPQPKKGALGAYLGIGGRFEEKKKDNEFGIRFVAGGNYWFEKYPVEVFLELVPVFEVSPDTGLGFDGGIGIRYYFSRFN